MPSRLQKVCLNLEEDSVLLGELLPAHSARHLEELRMDEDYRVEDRAAVKALCLNGKMRRISIGSSILDNGGAFCAGALWQAVPQTLQHVFLSLSLDGGIPKVLEQLLSLVTLELFQGGSDHIAP